MECRYFKIQELVPPSVYADRGRKAWELLDPTLLSLIDSLRNIYGPIIINTWDDGGNRSESGLRVPGCKYYRKYSQHSFGRAVDCLFSKTTVDKVREDILNNQHRSPYNLIRGLELNVPWLHIDVRNHIGIKTFRP
jgi:hypothetical protein